MVVAQKIVKVQTRKMMAPVQKSKISSEETASPVEQSRGRKRCASSVDNQDIVRDHSSSSEQGSSSHGRCSRGRRCPTKDHSRGIAVLFIVLFIYHLLTLINLGIYLSVIADTCTGKHSGKNNYLGKESILKCN